MYLTDAETLFIQRRRLNLNQKERAKQLCLVEWLYVEYEQDKRTYSAFLPTLNLKNIEECVIKRRREGWTQQEVADDIGCSRLWVIRMENGKANSDLLLDYWS